MTLERMRRHWSSVLIVTLLLSAGCLGGGSATGDSPTGTTDATEAAPTVETEVKRTAGTQTSTPTVVDTDEPVGTAGSPDEVVVKNYENRSVAVRAVVVRNATNTSILDMTMTLGVDGERNLDTNFPEPGNYTIRATVDGTTHTTTWEVEVVPLQYQIVVAVEDGEVRFTGSTA